MSNINNKKMIMFLKKIIRCSNNYNNKWLIKQTMILIIVVKVILIDKESK